MGGGGGDEARAGEFTWYDISFSFAFTYYIAPQMFVEMPKQTRALDTL